MAQNPLIDPVPSRDLEEQIDFSMTLAKLSYHLAEFFVEPLRFATPERVSPQHFIPPEQGRSDVQQTRKYTHIVSLAAYCKTGTGTSSPSSPMKTTS